jgi:hypothetical protein
MTEREGAAEGSGWQNRPGERRLSGVNLYDFALSTKPGPSEGRYTHTMNFDSIPDIQPNSVLVRMVREWRLHRLAVAMREAWCAQRQAALRPLHLRRDSRRAPRHPLNGRQGIPLSGVDAGRGGDGGDDRH